MRLQPGECRAGANWFLAKLDDVLVIRSARDVADEDYARYLGWVAEEIDASLPSERCGVMFDVIKGGSTTAARRKQWAEIVTPRRRKLQQVFAGCAVASASPIARGVVTALTWLVPPPIDFIMVASPGEALSWLSERLPGLQPGPALERYLELKQRCQSPDPTA